MSTPTASNPVQPSSASKKATGHVTTPSHLGLSSPAPRSVPSPAATRKDHAGKTPTNHPTASSHGSKTLGGTPMVQSLSQTGMTSSSSPGAHMLGFGTPSALVGLGVDLGTGTPGQMNMPTPLAGAAMMPTMSELGLTTSGGKRNEDEERRAKIRKVLKSIGKPKGRVNYDGVARVAKRAGFDVSLDPSTVVIAGNRVILEVIFQNQMLQKVTSTVFQKDLVHLEEYEAPITKVLLKNLAAPEGLTALSSLDRFAASLDRLKRMDRLSKDVNCFDAVDRLYKCLKRLYEEEKNVAKQSTESDVRAEQEVLRKKSGRPAIHTNGRIGMTVGYWSSESGSEVQVNLSGMEVDGADIPEPDPDDSPSVYSLRIETEVSPAAIYPSLRVSDAWLPDTLELPTQESGGGIPWQDPPPTYIPEQNDAQGDDMAIDGVQRLPDLRFVAKLDPPVVMPYTTAMNILTAVGAQPHQVFLPVPYHAMLIDLSAEALNSGAGVEVVQSVLTIHESQEVDTTHHYVLDVSKPEWGYKLDEIPFSHPRQIIELLPTLRQWGHFGSLVQNAFCKNPTTASLETPANGMKDMLIDSPANGIKNEKVSINDLTSPTNWESSTAKDTFYVDLAIATSPQPSLAVTFSDPATGTVSDVTVQLLPNADIVVTQITSGDSSMAGREDVDGDASHAELEARLAKALAVSGDLGVWIEWIRRGNK